VTPRHDQIASLLRESIQEVLARGLSDPRVRGLVSVVEVKLSTDLRQATVLVSVLPADREELTLHGLRHAAAHIRSQVARAVELRRVPELVFKTDARLKKEAGVLGAIAQIERERRERQPEVDDT
jgi:ribosome-binding factor A